MGSRSCGWVGAVGEKRKVSYLGEVSARPPLQSPPCHLRWPTFSPPDALIPLPLAGGINPPSTKPCSLVAGEEGK